MFDEHLVAVSQNGNVRPVAMGRSVEMGQYGAPRRCARELICQKILRQLAPVPLDRIPRMTGKLASRKAAAGPQPGNSRDKGFRVPPRGVSDIGERDLGGIHGHEGDFAVDHARFVGADRRQFGGVAHPAAVEQEGGTALQPRQVVDDRLGMGLAIRFGEVRAGKQSPLDGAERPHGALTGRPLAADNLAHGAQEGERGQPVDASILEERQTHADIRFVRGRGADLRDRRHRAILARHPDQCGFYPHRPTVRIRMPACVPDHPNSPVVVNSLAVR